MQRASRSGAGSAGFTLIELLIVVAIIGILAAIALPNLVWSLEKARQVRTVSDMRVLSQTVEIYFQDQAFYPRVGDTTTRDLVPHLTPYILQVLPVRDGWNKVMAYSSADGFAYTVLSYGANFAPDEPYVYGPTRRFREDIVWSNGVFIQWPEGRQMQ